MSLLCWFDYKHTTTTSQICITEEFPCITLGLVSFGLDKKHIEADTSFRRDCKDKPAPEILWCRGMVLKKESNSYMIIRDVLSAEAAGLLFLR